MIPEKKFSGVYPIFFMYFVLVSFGISMLFVIVFTLISSFFILPLFFIPVFSLPIWVIYKNNIRWVYFKKDHLSIMSIFGFEEIVEYKKLQKYSVKYEGFNNKDICTIQFERNNKKIKRVDFRTQDVEHRLFKAQLINLKRDEHNIT